MLMTVVIVLIIIIIIIIIIHIERTISNFQNCLAS